MPFKYLYVHANKFPLTLVLYLVVIENSPSPYVIFPQFPSLVFPIVAPLLMSIQLFAIIEP